MKKSDELRRQLEAVEANAQAIIDSDGSSLQEITDVNNKVDLARKKLEAQINIEANAQKLPKNGAVIAAGGPLTDEAHEKIAAYNNAFVNVLSGKATGENFTLLKTEIKNQLGSGTGSTGGYLIPMDQDTAIIELKRELTSLRKYVNVETVRTLSGSRNIEVSAENTPFVVIGEKSEFGDLGNPTFAKIDYTIKKYGGFMDVPNELLDDETASLLAYLNRWLAKKEVATENALIISTMKTATQVDANTIDEVKDILDKQLDPRISAMAKIFMNQTSFNAYNKMTDNDGRYILEADPKDKTKKMLGGKSIVVLSDAIFPNFEVDTKTKAPVGVGYLKDFVTLFDRKARSVETTRIGGDSWKEDTTSLRAILRMDVKKVDSDAFIMGMYEVAAV